MEKKNTFFVLFLSPNNPLTSLVGRYRELLFAPQVEICTSYERWKVAGRGGATDRLYLAGPTAHHPLWGWCQSPLPTCLFFPALEGIRYPFNNLGDGEGTLRHTGIKSILVCAPPASETSVIRSSLLLPHMRLQVRYVTKTARCVAKIVASHEKWHVAAMFPETSPPP